MPGAEKEVARRLKDCWLVGVPLYLIATLVAPFSPLLSLTICSGLWIFWACASIERGEGLAE